MIDIFDIITLMKTADLGIFRIMRCVQKGY